jgi:hypothetical protein
VDASDISPWRVDWMLGVPLIVATVVIHVIGLGLIQARVVSALGRIRSRRRYLGAFVVVVGVSTLLATALHAAEAATWAAAYYLLGALPNRRLSMLYSLGAMTTFGGSDLSVARNWQLMGAIEALNGLLLFGLTTAFLFAMIREVSPHDRGGRS